MVSKVEDSLKSKFYDHSSDGASSSGSSSMTDSSVDEVDVALSDFDANVVVSDVTPELPPWLQISPEAMYHQLEQVQSRLALLTIENEQLHLLKIENARLAAEKQQVTQELEELTRSLFEEANTLVASEAKARYLAERQVATLEKELKTNRGRLMEEMQQLEELKRKMQSLSRESSSVRGPFSAALLERQSGLQAEPSSPAPCLWKILSMNEIEEIAYPEMSFSDTKKSFYVEEEVSPSGELVGEKVETVTEQNSNLTLDVLENPPLIQSENLEKPQVQKVTHKALRKMIVNEGWLYRHYDDQLLSLFLAFVGRASSPDVLTHLKAKRRSLDMIRTSAQSLTYILENNALDAITDDASETRSTISLQVPQALGTSSRPQTPNNGFGIGKPRPGLVSQLTSKSTAAPIFRAFPGEYKKSGDPFIRRIYDEDIYPTLSFPLRTRQFVKQVLAVLAANKFTFEKYSFIYRDISMDIVPEKSVMLSTSPQVTVEEALAPESTPLSLTPMPSTPIMMAPITSLFRSSTPRANTPLPKPSTSIKCCEFCGKRILPLPPSIIDYNAKVSMNEDPFDKTCDAYRLVVEDPQLASQFGQAIFLVDALCRDKIVSVCDFFTFIRYYKAGFYHHLSNEALYAKWLHIKRNMFYSRTGAAPYFAAHDINKLVHLVDAKLDPIT